MTPESRKQLRYYAETALRLENISRLSNFQPVFNVKPEVVLSLLDDNDRMRKALEIIASSHRPHHDTEEYWNKVNHAQCATVLATDTKIARAALGGGK